MDNFTRKAIRSQIRHWLLYSDPNRGEQPISTMFSFHGQSILRTITRDEPPAFCNQCGTKMPYLELQVLVPTRNKDSLFGKELLPQLHPDCLIVTKENGDRYVLVTPTIRTCNRCDEKNTKRMEQIEQKLDPPVRGRRGRKH